MLIQQVSGNIKTKAVEKPIDWLLLEWYETHKRILHKRSQSGAELVLQFLDHKRALEHGDIVYEGEENVIVIGIAACDVITIRPRTMFEMAAICYEIGNKHLPLFHQEEELLVPFEPPAFRVLTIAGYDVKRECRQLLHSIKTTVMPHGGKILFSNNMSS